MLNKSFIAPHLARLTESRPRSRDVAGHGPSPVPSAGAAGPTVMADGLGEFYSHRPQPRALTPMDVNREIKGVSDLTRPCWASLPRRAGISIEMQHELEPNLPRVWAEPVDFREALMNLIFNAVAALPRGGIITLVTRSLAPEAADPRPRVRIEVRDNGVGMDDQTRRRCLEPFFTARCQGVGLGLTLVRGVTQQLGGTIEIDSAPGCGACVRLTLPVRNPSRPAPATPASN